MSVLFITYILSVILAIVLGKYVYDWYHETDKRNKMMEGQLRLLAQIAAAQGVKPEKIEEILLDAGYKGPKKPKK